MNPPIHPLEEGARHPQQELLYAREVRYLREAQGAHQPGGHREEIVGILPVRLPDPLHQCHEGDVLPECEVFPREPARVERDALPLADLEDGPDHPYVPTLLSSLADYTIFPPLCASNHEERRVVCRHKNLAALQAKILVRMNSSGEGFYRARFSYLGFILPVGIPKVK